MEYENKTLNDRETTHGDYGQTAQISQDLKSIIRGADIGNLNDVQCESLDLICTKIARILSGSPDEPDHWKDIAGYANLVSERLKESPKDIPLGQQKQFATMYDLFVRESSMKSDLAWVTEIASQD